MRKSLRSLAFHGTKSSSAERAGTAGTDASRGVAFACGFAASAAEAKEGFTNLLEEGPAGTVSSPSEVRSAPFIGSGKEEPVAIEGGDLNGVVAERLSFAFFEGGAFTGEACLSAFFLPVSTQNKGNFPDPREGFGATLLAVAAAWISLAGALARCEGFLFGGAAAFVAFLNADLR